MMDPKMVILLEKREVKVIVNESRRKGETRIDLEIEKVVIELLQGYLER